MKDLDIIKQIKKELNIKLSKLDEIKWRNFATEENKLGYVLNQDGQVTGLVLCLCEIKDLNRIISPLKDLKKLTELALSENELSDISSLQNLKNLTNLDLSSNELRDISPLKNLKKLTKLILWGNRINDISSLKDLKNLTVINLGFNKLRNISSLKELKNLTNLELIANQISDISPLKELKKLIKLRLSRNPINKLSSWITDFNMEFRWNNGGHFDGYITFYNNPLKSPPVEIIEQGKEAVKNYFDQLEKQGKDKIYEAKLMIVGEPGAGKSSLMNKLFDKDFPVPNDEQKATPGIEIRQNWEFSVEGKTNFKAHIWDFGGQQIQYMLHQFFLTSDCVYVLMAEKRKELANFDYWLNIINILGKNSPVIALFNEINIDSATSFIYDEKKYRELFPILELQKLDVNLSNITDGRFDVLINTIKDKLGGLEHIGQEVPARWVDIRTKLEERRIKKHITINEYFDICSKYEINKEADRLLILRYFHLIGIVLHFSDDPNLCDTLFLDPNWTVDAVYAVLNNDEIKNSNGVFKQEKIDKIWSEKGYGYNERASLLRLMLKDNFDLCYKLPGSNDEYIVPLLLSELKPEYDWDDKLNLQFRFQYPFMPKGIVSRLIVRMHEYIKDRIEWNEGAVFSKSGATAQIIERKTVKEGLKIIEIRLQGTPNSRKEFLTLIREEIRKIQDSSFHNLPYVEMVPCHCQECTEAETPYFFDYHDIETYLQKGKTEIDCRRSTEEVSIAKLIGSVFNIEEIESRYKKMKEENKNININLSNIGNPQQNVTQRQTSIQKATLTATQQQTVKQVNEVQGLFKNFKKDILDEIDIEIDDEKEKKRIQNELQNTENAFIELEKAASEGKKELDTGTKSRLEEFIDNLSDENSRINKALKLVTKGKDKAQALAKVYNKFAPFFALPSVPDILLGKK
ncbi:MAG: COR domain-containing protein [Candidatus Scalindua sp.]